MILLFAFALAVASVPLFGGRFSRMTRLQIRYSWLATAACVIQTVLISVVPGIGPRVGNVIHLATYAMAGLFLLANHRLPGVKLLTAGGGMNLVAIVANGGVMPASAWATRVAGLSTQRGEFANSKMVAQPKLLAFGDILAVPASWPLSNVFSIGDILLVVGAAVFLHVGTGSRLARHRAPNAPEVAAIPASV
jgi:hypothetical protein